MVREARGTGRPMVDTRRRCGARWSLAAQSPGCLDVGRNEVGEMQPGRKPRWWAAQADGFPMRSVFSPRGPGSTAALDLSQAGMKWCRHICLPPRGGIQT